MSKLKNVLLIQYYKEIIFRKIKSIFDTIKSFEKSEFSHLCHPCIHSSIPKIEKKIFKHGHSHNNQLNFVDPIWYSTTKVMQMLSNVALSSVLLPGNGN